MNRNVNDNLIEYDDIEIYNMIRSGTLKRFPNNFWGGLDSYKTAGELTRYLFEKILKWDLEQIKLNVNIDTFYDNRLGGMLSSLFNGRLYDALLNAYPELEEWINSKTSSEKIEKHESKYSITRYTDEELIQKLQDKVKELNRIPFLREMENPEGSIYLNRFGSWRKALVAAEIIEDILKDVDTSEQAKQKCQSMFKNFILENDRLPNKDEIIKLATEGEILEYFNSISGLYYYLNSEYSEDELINILRYKYNKLKRVPTNKDMKIPRVIIFVDKFGSWEKALQIAGLK